MRTSAQAQKRRMANQYSKDTSQDGTEQMLDARSFSRIKNFFSKCVCTYGNLKIQATTPRLLRESNHDKYHRLRFTVVSVINHDLI
jgi:hypothetical protein